MSTLAARIAYSALMPPGHVGGEYDGAIWHVTVNPSDAEVAEELSRDALSRFEAKVYAELGIIPRGIKFSIKFREKPPPEALEKP